jgi:hypothetical protein
MSNEVRLDASESVFFKRELESIDARVYEVKYPQYKARSLIPTQDGVSESDKVYTYRLYDTFGKAVWVGPGSSDSPVGEATGDEVSQIIRPLTAGYEYDIFEIKAAARQNRPLDSMKAMGARRALEELIDQALSLGVANVGLKGLLNLSNTTSFTPGTKAAGGLTWGTMAAPNATGAEVANDIMGICSKIVETTKGVFDRFNVLLPIEQYNYAAQVRIGSVSDTTALAFAKATSPFIADVIPWFRCDGAGAAVPGTTDRMVAYPYNPEVVSALVPMEIQFLPPQERELKFKRPGIAACGGVVCRYPVAVAYGDGI